MEIVGEMQGRHTDAATWLCPRDHWRKRFDGECEGLLYVPKKRLSNPDFIQCFQGFGRLFRPKKRNGGGGGIRTLDSLATILVFETSLFNHSSTPPMRRRLAFCADEGPIITRR
jgi:hypothetical protein